MNCTELLTPLAIFVPAIIAIISWSVNAKKMRELEEFKIRFKERFEVRKKMYDSIVDFGGEVHKQIKDSNSLDFKKPDLFKKASTMLNSVNLYGTSDEVTRVENFAELIRKLANRLPTEEENKKVGEILNSILTNTRDSLRADLDIK